MPLLTKRKTTSEFTDTDFGRVIVRRNRLARAIKLKIDQRGVISISMPPLTPLWAAKKLLDNARGHIKDSLAKLSTKQRILQHGDLIGKTHKLEIIQGAQTSRIIGTTLQVSLPAGADPESHQSQAFIKDAALKALRTQAKAYLSRRLHALAEQHDFRFSKLRFSNAGTRWGSCSSHGTISLNIWLMQLPFELIDYVLVHELCHTRQMNHSPKFWAEVAAILPNYKDLRRSIKAEQPYA